MTKDWGLEMCYGCHGTVYGAEEEFIGIGLYMGLGLGIRLKLGMGLIMAVRQRTWDMTED